MVITIPETVENALRIPGKNKEKELRKLLTLKLYEKGILGMGKARELLGVTRLEFLYTLKEEGIPINYDQEELEQDLEERINFRLSGDLKESIRKRTGE